MVTLTLEGAYRHDWGMLAEMSGQHFLRHGRGHVADVDRVGGAAHVAHQTGIRAQEAVQLALAVILRLAIVDLSCRRDEAEVREV